MNKQDHAVDYLRAIVTPLTKEPEAVVINVHLDDSGRGIVLNVIASDTDLALLIGKKGSMARSIRKIMNGWSELNMARVLLHIGNPIQHD